MSNPTIDTSRDLPGMVHGIVSLDPLTVRCDGCGYEYTDTHGNLSILCSGIEFNPKRYTSRTDPDQRRLCRDCRAMHWPETLGDFR